MIEWQKRATVLVVYKREYQEEIGSLYIMRTHVLVPSENQRIGRCAVIWTFIPYRQLVAS
jgi:hypothetical protein